MDFSQMQRMVIASTGNMKSGHPLYKWITGDSGTDTPSVINLAANRLIRMIPERLPEIPAAWTIGVTVNGNNWVDLPSDLIALTSLVRAETATAPNWAAIKGEPVPLVTPEEFDLLSKEDEVGYPRIATRRGKKLYFWPTATTAYLAYFRAYGLMDEVELVNAADEFYVDDYWHHIICRIATAMIEEMRGNFKRHEHLMASVRQEIGDARDMSAEENLAAGPPVRVVGAPTRASVYGK